VLRGATLADGPAAGPELDRSSKSSLVGDISGHPRSRSSTALRP